MGKLKMTVPQNIFYADEAFELSFPDEWTVELKEMAGDALPPLTAEQIKESLNRPVGSPTIRELAAGKKEVCIVFDDMSRPTNIEQIAIPVLEELHAAGIEDEQIRFICGLGLHGAHTLIQFQKKLGVDIPARYPVYNHNPYENCTYLGTTSQGTPVSVNSEYWRCDLRIAIGCLVPHPLSTYGGGGKIILPGVASIETIHHNHRFMAPPSPSNLAGEPRRPHENHLENPMYQDITEAARLAGLHFKIDALVNTRRQTVGLVCGDLAEAHQVGIEQAKDIYATEKAEDADIVVANAYSKGNEAMLATGAWQSHTKKGDPVDLVLVYNFPEGMVVHYLYGGFGERQGGRLWGARKGLPHQARRFIIVSPYMERAAYHFYAPAKDIHWTKSWEQALELLQSWHPNGARVAVYPDRTIQKLYPVDEPRG